MQYDWPLIGHENVKKYFAKALGAGRIRHAYLFEGPSQIGKATFARMLSKTLLCESDGKSVPCRTCRACTAFDHGAHPDFLLLARGDDEHISIESVRECIAALATRPLLGTVRIGMIDEAAKLTPEAANALLKTLEEPGSAVVLFLITDRPMLPTVASRCQRIKFGFVGTKEIENHLEGIPQANKIAALAFGRPGLAAMLKDPDVLSDALKETAEVYELMAKDDGARMLWIIEQFGGRLSGAQRRERCVRFLETLEQVLHARLPLQHEIAPMLRRTLAARGYLEANVDPRLICEYILFS